MKHTILCFSGTGNSYYVASKLAEGLDNAPVVMIPDLMENPQLELTEAVGFVFPTHYFLPPVMIVEFIEQVIHHFDWSAVQYCYAVTTKNLTGGWAQKIVEILLHNQGIALAYTSSVRFANTYIPLFTAPNILQIEFYYKHADKKIAKIIQELTSETIRPPYRPPFTRMVIENHMSNRFEKTLRFAADSFLVTNACDGCELCYRICPSGTITMVDEKPTFGLTCTSCLACYHRCPKEAIVFNRRVSSGHYPNVESNFDKEYRE
ncbi:MAG: EFR1 family ferrodoxin [Sphaerochaeta sp.]